MLLNVLDSKPFKCQIKGGHTWAQWEKVYITSNKNYNEWYPSKNEGEEIEPLKRRIYKIIIKNRKKGVAVREPIIEIEE